MALPEDRVPTLVQYCQRVAAVHVDGPSLRISLPSRTDRDIPAISSLGEDFRYDLVKPILERCNVDQLLRLEQASPVRITRSQVEYTIERWFLSTQYLQKDTPGMPSLYL